MIVWRNWIYFRLRARNSISGLRTFPCGKRNNTLWLHNLVTMASQGEVLKKISETLWILWRPTFWISTNVKSRLRDEMHAYREIVTRFRELQNREIYRIMRIHKWTHRDNVTNWMLELYLFSSYIINHLHLRSDVLRQVLHLLMNLKN